MHQQNRALSSSRQCKGTAFCRSLAPIRSLHCSVHSCSNTATKFYDSIEKCLLSGIVRYHARNLPFVLLPNPAEPRQKPTRRIWHSSKRKRGVYPPRWGSAGQERQGIARCAAENGWSSVCDSVQPVEHFVLWGTTGTGKCWCFAGFLLFRIPDFPE